MPRPVHYELAASDPERLPAFCTDVFVFCQGPASTVLGGHQTDPQAGPG